MINNKIWGLVGLAARARKVCFGADSVEQEIIKKKVKLVLIAEDSSKRTKTKFEKICNDNNVKFLILGDISTMSKAIGKNNKAIVGIEEENLAKQIQKIYCGGDDIG